VEHMREAVFTLDLELRIRSWSNGAELIFGWPAGEAIGRAVFPLLQAELSEDEAGQFMKRLSAKGTDRVVGSHRRKDGVPIVVDTNFAVLKDGDGRLTGFLGVCRDVTEQKSTESALRESEQRFRAIFEQAAVGIAQADERSGRFLRVNDKLCEIVGYSREDMLGQTWFQVTHPDDLLAGRASHERMVATHRSYSRQKRYLRKDGKPVWVNVTVAPMWAQDAEPTSFVSVVEDVTATKNAAEALRESEERFRIAFQTSPDSININRLEDGLFVTVNEGFSRMTGWTAEEVIGRTSLEVHIWDDPADRERLVAGLKKDGYYENLEARFRRKDGSTLSGLMSARLITLRSKRYLLSITRDISEWRRAEQERDRLRADLHQVAKMEAIGQLAGGVAHDFNNLLTVILAGAEAMKQDLSDRTPLDPEILEEIAGAGRRARDLTRQLLAFARKQVIAPVPLDLNGLMGSVEKLLRRVLGEDIELSIALEPALGSVKCDPGQIEQVILNLAVNARDAMPQGGVLRIETHNVEVGARLTSTHPFMQAGPYVCLSVSDSGSGMSAEVKAHAFEPFFTTKPVGRGTGLGLATVYGIVKQSDGYILLDSAPGEGATFSLYFPRIVDTASAREPPAPALPVQGNETLLVVEDDPQVRAITVRSLRSGGYTVLSAGGGREAIDLGLNTPEPLHLLVTDVVMPGLDGRAVAEALRRCHPRLPVLYVSGHTQEAIVERGVLEPGIEFLPKPFTASTLLARVRSILDAAQRGSLAQLGTVKWSDLFATGVRQIDLEHRELIYSAGALGEAIRKGNLARAADILERLESYASKHFRAEERFMESAAYPRAGEHRSAHELFASELSRRRADYQASGPVASAMVEIHEWLAAWLEDHVAGADGQLARYLRREGR
ncbi:MAG TPA: bacteriohemerythrin, partial [Anaeromyxobacteraceae bacterium]|nr:bacteriohemerythrin [Anaeromyxobacteraceae bacterium]